MPWTLPPYNGQASEWEFALAPGTDTEQLSDKEKAQVQATQELAHQLVASADPGETIALAASGSDTGCSVTFQYLAATSPQQEPQPTAAAEVAPAPAGQVPQAPPPPPAQ